MKQFRNLTALLLSAVLLASVSCGEAAKPETGTDAETAAQTNVQTEQKETLTPEEQNEADLKEAAANLPAKDYGGHVFTVIDRGTAYSDVWAAYDVYAEETNGDPINDAVFRRNQILEEHFNIKIKDHPVNAPAGEIRTNITAGDDTYDTVLDSMRSLYPLSAEGYLCDLHTLPELKLDSPWWDPLMTDAMSIAGKSFYVTGDISVMDNEATWCMLFNKKMIGDYDLDDPYQLVRDGKWTLDAMFDMAKAAASDLNGDGKMTGADDQFGYLTEDFNIYAMWSGCGNTILSKDKDDLPVASFYNERSSAIYDKVIALQTADFTGGDTRQFKKYADMNKCYSEGRALFQYGAMGLISDYRESTVDFGILPAPKYDEAQEAYRNAFSNSNMTVYSVPTTASDLSRTAVILESMAELSRYTLTPAYLDVSLKGKFTRDEESAETIDLILNTRSYDLGSIIIWDDVSNIFYNSKASAIGTMSSQYEKCRKKLEKHLSDFVNSMNLGE